MAASMIAILKQIQHDIADQKEYMRNINEKYNIMTGKIDQQQGIIEKLEQHVRKNNMLLFGDEKEVNFEDNKDKTALYTPAIDDEKKGHLVEQSEEKVEENELKILSKVAGVEDIALNCEDDNRTNDMNQKAIVGEDQAKEAVTLKFDDDKELTPAYGCAEKTNKLTDDFKQTTIMCQSEIKEIKELLKDFVPIIEATVGDDRCLVCKQEKALVSSTNLIKDQINDLKSILDVYQSDMKKIKEFIEDFAAKNTETADSEIIEQEEKLVQISPTYFSTDQIGKLNAELKQIANKYKSTNIFPIIEVVAAQAEEHYVVKELSKGLIFPPKNGFNTGGFGTGFKVKLGMSGFKRSVVQDLVTDYPNFTLYDVIREGLISTYQWNKVCDKYDWDFPQL